ncbi:MAG: DegT/DnrJ/EryC1/StrS family aminotransferase [Candidatus Obscuribacterales bacterium]|nr:DegT/DnrJ/EryC1/StrS family aminotransferase [Cyanobacteria bacterium SZAS LIN-5]RTL45933.1 MAG: DegT/DnrJ/EryC1/StrS family aminotransferase [Candidatus Melainabacteria bacterium]
MTNIPLLNLKEQYRLIGNEIEQAVLDVLRSGSYILGQNGAKLEQEIAAICGCKYGIGVANGTDALVLALWALNVGPGDEVITSPFTFAATVEAITLRGATPVFVDADEQTFNIDPNLIEAAITPRTKAIMPVHLYGLPADMDRIMDVAKRYDLKVIEDNAQAIGALYKGKPTGSFGDVACTSFYPTKNLGAAGDAGMLVTNNPETAERLKCLRAHGSKQRYFHEELGVNSRLDEIQAAVLLTKLPYLKKWNDGRQVVADMYEQAFKGVQGIIAPSISLPGVAASVARQQLTHVWHQYTVRVLADQKSNTNARDEMVKQLAERGIGSMCYYPVPLHVQQAFAYLGYKHGDFPVAETLAKEVVSLPMYPELTNDQVKTVVATMRDVIAERAAFVPAAGGTPVFTG